MNKIRKQTYKYQHINIHKSYFLNIFWSSVNFIGFDNTPSAFEFWKILSDSFITLAEEIIIGIYLLLFFFIFYLKILHNSVPKKIFFFF